MRAFKGHGPTVELGPFLHPVSIETLDSTAYEGARGGIIAVHNCPDISPTASTG